MKHLICISIFAVIISSCVPIAHQFPVVSSKQTEYQDYGHDLAWSPNDQLLSVTTNTGLYVYNTNTLEQLATITGLSGAVVTFSKNTWRRSMGILFMFGDSKTTNYFFRRKKTTTY